MLDLDTVLGTTAEMRPLPATTARLTQLLSASDVDLREVARVVALDAPLTARLLRTANSSLYGGRIVINSVDQAVTRLGSGVVLSLALSATLKRELMTSLAAYGMGEGVLWRRSIASALAADSLKQSLKFVHVPGVAYTAALLHDIGRIVLARFVDTETRSLLDRAQRAESADAETIEQQMLGVHHAELGAIIAQRWKLPHVIVHAIEHYHDPDAGTIRLRGYEEADDGALDTVCDIVHVADAISRRVVSVEVDALDSIAPGALTRLLCDRAVVESACQRTGAKFEETVALFG